MSDDSLERILDFNRELATLSSIGLPFDIETDPSESIADRLQRINSALESRVRRGQSIQQAMADEPLVSFRYQSAASAWLRCDDPTVALDGLAAGAVARRRLRAGFNQWTAYPLIVATLTYAGLLVLCTFTVPRIEALLHQIGNEPTGVILLLIQTREWMPVWSVAVPVLAVALYAWLRWRPRRHMPSDSTRGSGYLATARHADMAERITRLLEGGISEPESLALVTDHVDRTGRDKPDPQSLPPLLGWALTSDLDDQSRPKVMRMVAQTYRQAADRKGRIWRTIASGVVGILVGGVFVLGYSVTVFQTMIELLQEVALRGGN
jgi:type II secretory pathway component PulF